MSPQGAANQHDGSPTPIGHQQESTDHGRRNHHIYGVLGVGRFVDRHRIGAVPMLRQRHNGAEAA